MQDGNTHPDLPAGSNLPAPRVTPIARPLSPAENHALSLDLRSPEPNEPQDELDLLSYWRILIKRKWAVLGTVATVMTAVAISTLLTTPIYRATSTLQIERDTIQVLQVEGMQQTDADWDGDFYQTQYELLKSRALAERVASQLNLAQSGEMDRMKVTSPWQKLLGMFRSEPDPEDEPPVVKDSAERKLALARSIQGGLSIEPVRNTRLVRVHFDSPDAEFSTRVSNAVSEAFIASNLERRFDSSSYAKGYLEDRLQELKLKLEDSERKLVEFAQKEQIVGVGGEATLTEQNLSSINSAWAKAREDRIRAESRWRQAQAAQGTSLPADVLGTSIIQRLQENRARLAAEYQDKLRVYKPEFPSMLQLKAQLDEVDRQIVGEVANIKGSIQAEYLAAQEQESMLASQLQGLKGEFLDLQNRSIQYNIYKREVDTNRQLYDGLLQRYKEIGIAGGVSTNNVSVVDRALNGFKFKPSLTRNLQLALLVGLMLGVLLALALEYLDDTIKTPEDLEKQLGLAVLGVIPKLKGITPKKALEDPRSAFAESYRSVRTALQFSTDSGAPGCLLVVSATPSEGKTTTAVTLARNFAQLGKRVLVIDGDLRNASLHKALGLTNEMGLCNLLAGHAKPMDVIVATDEPNLWAMTSGPLPPNPAELLAGSKMLSLLTVAVEKYDKVIIDGPPVLGLADAPILSNIAHATLLVVESSQTRVTIARNALKRLRAARAYVVGALLTKYDAQSAGYGYGYGDYSYYSYGGNDSKAKLTKQ